MADRRTCDTRRSYSREEKLTVTQWYWNNGRNLYQTCKNFNLNSKTVLRWLKGERKIRASRKGRKRVEFDQKPQYPALEDTLYQEYRNHRQRGVKIKGWWFKTRAKQLLQATAGTSVALSLSFPMHGSMDSSDVITSVYGVQLIKHRVYQWQRSSWFKTFIERFARKQQWDHR